jgi:alkylation response protein AidB-like acyl-CoA dehydrogenase
MSQFVQRRDIDFLLHEVFDLKTLLDAPRYRAHDRESISAMLDSAEAVARKHFLPIAGLLDANEPKFVEGRVEIPSEARAALRAHAEAGFFALGFDEADGGLQAPTVAVLMASGIFTCANLSLANYAFLTAANANMLRAFGTEDQRRRYLPPMLEGRWFGTMCLSEPQAGSSLADIATKAEPLPDSFYRLKGSKMWISGGDHELADNIVHMVLAKIPGGPPGVKGISLFLAPRYRVEADGSLGSWNNIALAGLNHKMGQRGTVNCLLNFSEGGDTLATLIGEPGKGLAYMFHMMNEARLGVGHAAAMCGLGGYLSSLEYARQRLQGRLPNNKDPSSPPVPIIEHADVKRMLLAQKAAVEGAMALTGYCAYLVDLQKIADDAAERERLDALLGVLTPVAKSWPSEHCLEANKHAIQILGGYGYTRDFPVERFYRDNRLNPIHEGALGIQAIDLLGRKVRLDGGLGFDLLCAKIEDAVALGRLESELSAETAALQEALDKLRATTRAVLASNDLALGLANATIYLDAFGHVVIGWMWLWQATVATRALRARADGEERLFYMGKLAACRYFFGYELPKIDAAFALVGSLDDACLSFESSWF